MSTNNALEPEVAHARHRSPYALREKIGRLLWNVTQVTLFYWTWPTWYRYRAWLLRLFGAKIHPTARIRRTARIECPWNLTIGPNSAIGDRAILYCLGSVTLGARVTISQYAHLCAGSHDYTQITMPLTRPPITIQDDAWIAADAFVGPGITIGTGALLGARSCAYKDLDPWTIYGGNPAKIIKSRKQTKDSNQTRDRKE